MNVDPLRDYRRADTEHGRDRANGHHWIHYSVTLWVGWAA
jgi:hypothetical protein